MKPLAIKSKQKKNLLILVTVFFAVLALLYLNSFLQDQNKSSVFYFGFMMILLSFSGWQLIKLNLKPNALAEYDDANIYLYTGKKEITIPWEQLQSAKRKGHKNRIGTVQYGDIVFLTIDRKKHTITDVDNPDDVIIKIQSILNKMDT